MCCSLNQSSPLQYLTKPFSLVRGKVSLNSSINQPATKLPFPLTKEELSYFEGLDLAEVKLEDYIEPETIPIRRFRVEYKLETAEN